MPNPNLLLCRIVYMYYLTKKNLFMSNPTQVPSKGTFQIVLSKTLSGKTVLNDPNCTFSYVWDFNTNKGEALLDLIDGKLIGIVLHPEGLSGTLAFMSDMKPTTYSIDGQNVVIYRVIMMINPKTGEHQAAIMFNQDGSTIEVSANWPEELASTHTLFQKLIVS